ncbi:hypothetical protein LTR36_007229 [Oleoguttula mirabilis]|uniref:Alpha-L-rhamnosidase n=1 Tax=Oleoguttula mirabilis TaxID=1507867 RepID=A0AAV9JB49_9PEZI|nr:hypothetical protein LTR36_007229 [Oleoguttula mirabilis]
MARLNLPSICYTALACTLLVASDSQQPWEQYNRSPTSWSLSPKSIYRTTGNASAQGHAHELKISMHAGSHVSLDFGIEVGGHVSFNIDSNSSRPVSLAFAESPSFVRPISDDTGALPAEDYDLALAVHVAQNSSWYITPKDSFRGGFRFVTINALADVTVSNITCTIGYAPYMHDLRDYSGYFYTSDPDYEVLNRIFFTSAYTVQTNIAPQDTGRFLPQVKPGWDYNATIGVGKGPFLVDGAKRDRAIWPGDLGVSGVTAFLAFGSDGLEAVHNALETVFYYQNSSTGEFPFAGPDTASFQSNPFQSDTYHAWSLISMYDYAMFSGDQAWLNRHWANISGGVDFTVRNLDSAIGLQNQTQTNDWGRQGSGGFNLALNALDYHALLLMASLTNSSAQSHAWLSAAERLKRSYNDLLWDACAGLYRDNGTTSLHPQDGNAMAVLYNLTANGSQVSSISEKLTHNWNAIGPLTPELPDTISPFVSGLEVLAHFRADQPQRALLLMQRLWGYLLDSPLMTGSTISEGITANGSLYYRSTAGYNHDASYTSLSHGWSSAPVQVMVVEMLGLKITGLGGRTWTLRPQPAGLSDLQGGFRTVLGKFDAAVKVENDGKRIVVHLATPITSKGQVPLNGRWQTVTVNGRVCQRNGNACVVPGGLSTVMMETAAPTVLDGVAYYPTWSRDFVALDYKTCQEVWNLSVVDIITNFAPVTSDQKLVLQLVSRSSPQIDGEVLYFTTLVHALLVAVNINSGKVLSTIQLNAHPMAQLTMSPTVYRHRIFLGSSSFEEVAVTEIPGYQCCSFIGDICGVDFDVSTNEFTIAWNVPTLPAGQGWSGAAIWGSQPSIDIIRSQLVIGTGNVYTVPDAISQCQNATMNLTVVINGSEPDPCFINWATILTSLDAWTLACGLIGGALPRNAALCPYTPGPDADFGMAPTFVPGSANTPFSRDTVVVGQKNGALHALSAQGGRPFWTTVSSPDGSGGGLIWGIAVDSSQVHFTAANTGLLPWQPFGSTETINGSAFGAADLKTGSLVWETVSPGNSTSVVPPTVVNDVVLVGRTTLNNTGGPGAFLVLDKHSGEILREVPLDSSFHGGIAVQDGYVMFGTGYTGSATTNSSGSFHVWST